MEGFGQRIVGGLTFEEEENRVQTDMEDVEDEGGRARTVRAQQSTGPESESRVPAGIPNVPPLWRPPFLPLFPRTNVSNAFASLPYAVLLASFVNRGHHGIRQRHTSIAGDIVRPHAQDVEVVFCTRSAARLEDRGSLSPGLSCNRIGGTGRQRPLADDDRRNEAFEPLTVASRDEQTDQFFIFLSEFSEGRIGTGSFQAPFSKDTVR
ncbi:hypothetical protein VTO73DRAFT_506 [Trametes versicolor]